MFVARQRDRRFGAGRRWLLLAMVCAGIAAACLAPVLPAGCSSAAALPEAPVTPAGAAVTVTRVVDGDTIWVRLSDGSEERVRYIGMDAPEVAHEGSAGEYLGGEATTHNAGLLRMGPVRLQTDTKVRDDYGRLLAYVWAGDIFVNVQMVRDGYARARNYPPNLAHQDQLWQANDEARRAGIGIWSKK